jgi:hypothetical protein
VIETCHSAFPRNQAKQNKTKPNKPTKKMNVSAGHGKPRFVEEKMTD